MNLADPASEFLFSNVATLNAASIESAGWAARSVGGKAAHIGVMTTLHPLHCKKQIVVAIDAEHEDVDGRRASFDIAARTIAESMESTVSFTSCDTWQGRNVANAGRRVFSVYEHHHAAHQPLPGGATQESWREQVLHELQSAGQDSTAFYRAIIRALDYGYYSVAYSASNYLLLIDLYEERATAVRMLTLNRCCMHEAAEARGVEYLREHRESAAVLCHLAKAVSFQGRHREALVIAERVLELEDRLPGSVSTALIDDAAAMVAQLETAA